MHTLLSFFRTIIPSGGYGLLLVFASIGISLVQILSPPLQASITLEPFSEPLFTPLTYGLETHLLLNHQQEKVVSLTHPENNTTSSITHTKTKQHKHRYTSHKKELPKKPVNINKATDSELARLPGIGPKMATRILQHRKAHGMFKTVDEFIQVKGIGTKKLAKMRPYITVAKN